MSFALFVPYTLLDARCEWETFSSECGKSLVSVGIGGFSADALENNDDLGGILVSLKSLFFSFSQHNAL